MNFELYPLFPTVIYKKNVAVIVDQSELGSIYCTDMHTQRLGNGTLVNAFVKGNIGAKCADLDLG